MQLNASDFYSLYRPSKCGGRVYLRHKETEESPAGPYEEVLHRLGEKHESSHLKTFPVFVDLGSGSPEERERKTREEIGNKVPVLYHALLRTIATIKGTKCEVIGEPDFIIREKDGYVIRDSKISRRITEKDHPEILRQLELYGWLFEQMLGKRPQGLQVHSGTGEIVPLLFNGGATALHVLSDILTLKRASSEPYSPVGWTKCGGCPFNYLCWPRAESRQDVALVAGVDQGLANALKRAGIKTIQKFLQSFDEKKLANFERPWGIGTRRVGKKAGTILRMARCQHSGKEMVLQAPDVPDSHHYAMFDLEGLPPHLDELEKMYLWGLQVFGEEKEGDYMPALAEFGDEGDHEGWKRFIDNAEVIFNEFGDIPFVHWHHYERVRLDIYIERYGDRAGIAARVKQNLLDLLPVCQSSIALPLPSYSLKVVEKYIGFQRSQDEYGGE